MGRNCIKLEKDEGPILAEFWSKLRATLKNAYNYSEEEADFETLRYILKETTKPPKEFFKIFMCVPKEAQTNILQYLGFKSLTAFKKNFNKQINTYRQAVSRRNQQEE